MTHAPSPKAPARKRGRKLTTGRFETREELVEAVWRDYEGTPRKMTEIGRAFRVSPGVVASILEAPRPAGLPRRKEPG